ncbi:MAG: MSMEG_0567/Sll0786 family nitrogen starvation N-acetyltransferase [Gaiellaceae bacterium]
MRLARGGELAEHHEIRHRVFVEAQRVFAGDDRDERDDEPGTLHVVGLVDGRVGGAVRLYPTDDRGRWKGDRLAVLAEYRHCRLGAVLVDFAVRTAGERGGHTMGAHIQPANVAFFHQLGWEVAGPPVVFHELVHQPMTIDLRLPFR